MIYEIPEYKLAEMLEHAAESGAKKVLAAQGLIKTQVSHLDACRRFSVRLIDRWRKAGKIVPVKIGNKIYYDLTKLEILSKTNDLYGRRNEESGNPDMDVSQIVSSKFGITSKDGQNLDRRRRKATSIKQTTPTN